MLKNIQVKIVLIFLIIGIAIIGIIGYINYINLQEAIKLVQSSNEGANLILADYQSRIKIITIVTICTFTLICIFVRKFYNSKSNFTDNKAY